MSIVNITDRERDLTISLKKITAERDALKVDAKRYQWLRNPDNFDASEVIEQYDGENLDSAIDAAMNGEQA